MGSVGDAFDDALADTTIGLYKNECIRADSPFRRGPLKTAGDVEDLVIVSPDAGGVKAAKRFANHLGADLAFVNKIRPKGVANVVEASNVIGHVAGKRCILLDDMIVADPGTPAARARRGTAVRSRVQPGARRGLGSDEDHGLRRRFPARSGPGGP